MLVQDDMRYKAKRSLLTLSQLEKIERDLLVIYSILF